MLGIPCQLPFPSSFYSEALGLAPVGAFSLKLAAVLTKIGEIVIPFTGTFRVKFLAFSSPAGVTGGARIYKGGAAYGTSQTLTTSIQSFSQDLQFNKGDLCQLYIQGDATNTAYAGALSISLPGNGEVDL